ncbi:hypothetical protein [Schleiferilactobacillus harbinensis]|jgi:hypothetical protein|uniref:hypothetical protein n=1 Tax=Schleiferilactobacillus harbinensis TaxID=304207 RepID=UPI00242B579D|nr:hypothetical protein [Schleiferilactobacillus harbinensis]MCI1686686.1 hypothetical protein [Schleiferilactobacillus harbinensis]MCI1783785.1 hypothetical protein [Schleiferilactobacillus harbinensis]MCI1849352.1 hypothetical protein [Schleiferilactobacillus harbinensis]
MNKKQRDTIYCLALITLLGIATVLSIPYAPRLLGTPGLLIPAFLIVCLIYAGRLARIVSRK